MITTTKKKTRYIFWFRVLYIDPAGYMDGYIGTYKKKGFSSQLKSRMVIDWDDYKKLTQLAHGKKLHIMKIQVDNFHYDGMNNVGDIVSWET